jgi:hypothetical protein
MLPPANLMPARNQLLKVRKKTTKPDPSVSSETPMVAHPDTLRQSQQTNDYLRQVHFLVELLIRQHSIELAFRLGLSALGNARQPAATKYIEVYNYHWDHAIIKLLKSITLNATHITLLVDICRQLNDEPTTATVLPLALASYAFGVLCTEQRASPTSTAGFDACLRVLAMKSQLAECDHALLCERHRRERGDLALAMLVHVKDNQERVGQVLHRLLDPDMHKLYVGAQCSQCIYHILGGHSHSHVKQHMHNEINAAEGGLVGLLVSIHGVQL